MSKIKRLQRQLDRANKGTNNTTEATDSREEIVDVLGNKGGKLYDKINTPKSSYQGVAPMQGMSDEQARNIDEDTYPDGPSRKSALNMLGIKNPLNFKGANSSNSSCWKGYKKVGTKPSPSGTGETVNDCKKI